MANGQEMGYMEQAFRERAGIASAQYEELAKERAGLSRQLKQYRRGDFKQQRQREKTQIKNVGRRVYFRKRPSDTGMLAVRGGGRQGTVSMGRRGGLSSQEKAAEAYGRSLVETSGMQAGGIAQVGAAQRWTTSGWKEAKPGEDVSVYIARQMAQTRKTPQPGTLTFLRPKTDQTKSLTERPGATSKIKTKFKMQQQEKETRRQRIERLRKLQFTYGPEAAQKVLAEWDKRQAALMGGGGGLFGGLFGKSKD